MINSLVLRRLAITGLVVQIGVFAQAQTDGVLIDYTGSTRDNSAVLDVRSATQGVLLPRVSSGQRTSIGTLQMGY